MAPKRNLQPKEVKTKATVTTDVQPTKKDEQFAEVAFVKIQTIILEHRQNALLDVAQYLFETFFDKNIDLMKERKPADNRVGSYNQLIKLLQESDEGAPKKTSMYDAIGVYVDTNTLEKEHPEAFRTYGKLPISHKIKLRTVKMEDKLALIQECEDKNYTVVRLREEIAKKRGKKKTSISEKTYLAELKGVRSDLKKRLNAIGKLPVAEKEKAALQDIENALDSMIEEMDEYILEQKK
jgi:hypothetical protein